MEQGSKDAREQGGKGAWVQGSGGTIGHQPSAKNLSVAGVGHSEHDDPGAECAGRTRRLKRVG